MLGWERPAACWASARKRARKVGSPVYSLRRTFTATGRPRRTSVPRQTCPMPPAAISSASSYRSPRLRRPGSTTVVLSSPVTQPSSTARERRCPSFWMSRTPVDYTSAQDAGRVADRGDGAARSGPHRVRPPSILPGPGAAAPGLFRHDPATVAPPGRGRRSRTLPVPEPCWIADPAGPRGRRRRGGATMPETVTREDVGGVATITMLRPGLTHESRRELLDVVREVAADDSVRAVVITGTGRAFCVGQDLGQHVQALRGDAATSLSVVEDEYNPLVLALAALRVPVVVAVNGAAAGAGLGIALAGDLRVAALGAKFTTAFAGIGLSSDSGLAARLVHCVGGSRAAELLLLPEPFPAERAAEWGLVHRVVPRSEEH